MVLHLDVKKLRQIERPSHRVTKKRRDQVCGAGPEFVFVAIDDPSYLALTDILPNERVECGDALLEVVLLHIKLLDIRVERVMTEHGSCVLGKAISALLRVHGIRHVRTRPNMPRTKVKAERFIHALARESASARTYRHARGRAADLPKRVQDYIGHRKHVWIRNRHPSPVSTSTGTTHGGSTPRRSPHYG